MMQKNFQLDKGMILADILIALSLAVLFIAIIASSSIDSWDIYLKAKVRNELLSKYETSSSTDNQIKRHFFGNEMIQDDFEITSALNATSTLDMANSTSSLNGSNYSSSLNFTQVSGRWQMVGSGSGSTMIDNNLDDMMGTPLCSVDFSNDDIVGSYKYDLTHNRLQGILSPNIAQQNNFDLTITPITLPIDPSLPLTDFEVKNGIAYISIDSAVASDQDLIIVNIKNKNDPKILSSINTGPGIASIVLAGRRIYAATPSTVGQLQIIRINSLDNIVLEKRYKLPLPTSSTTPTIANTIFFKNNYIFLGTEKWDGDEFNIIDVFNPLQPIKVGGLEINSKVNDIYVRDGLVYIASADQKQLIVADISDIEHPAVVNSFSPTGWSRQEGKVISSFENKLDFGRTSGGYNIVSDHEAFIWRNAFSTSSTPAASLSDISPASQASLDIPGGVYGIIADRSNIYIATRQIDKEIQIFDKNLSASTSKAYSLPIAPQMMTCDGDNLYVLAHNAPFVYEIKRKNNE